MYEEGINGSPDHPQNLDKASFYYNKALKLKPDYLEAKFNLGLLLNQGQEQSKKEGMKLIKEAANKGYVRAKEYIML